LAIKKENRHARKIKKTSGLRQKGEVDIGEGAEKKEEEVRINLGGTSDPAHHVLWQK